MIHHVKTCENYILRNLKICHTWDIIVHTPYTVTLVKNIILSRFGLILANCVLCTGLAVSCRRTVKKRACSAIDQEPWSSSTSRHFSPSLDRLRRPHAFSVKSQLVGARQRLPKHPQGSAVERFHSRIFRWQNEHRREDDEGEVVRSVAKHRSIYFRRGRRGFCVLLMFEPLRKCGFCIE